MLSSESRSLSHFWGIQQILNLNSSPGNASIPPSLTFSLLVHEASSDTPSGGGDTVPAFRQIENHISPLEAVSGNVISAEQEQRSLYKWSGETYYLSATQFCWSAAISHETQLLFVTSAFPLVLQQVCSLSSGWSKTLVSLAADSGTCVGVCRGRSLTCLTSWTMFGCDLKDVESSANFCSLWIYLFCV